MVQNGLEKMKLKSMRCRFPPAENAMLKTAKEIMEIVRGLSVIAGVIG